MQNVARVDGDGRRHASGEGGDMGTAGGTPPGRVRQVASLAIAGALIVTSIWLAHVTGGAGAMAFGLAALAAGIGWKWWRGTFRGVRWVAAVALV